MSEQNQPANPSNMQNHPVPALVNLGELSKPATVLVEKIADAIGGIFKPWQIRRVAQAEAEAEQIHAASQIQITDLQRRALHRFIVEEAKKQQNIESIVQKALPEVGEQARPQDVKEDWITNFFDKCRLESDEDMQALWAKILSGEANAPGKYSKRTVGLLASLDKSGAELFKKFCSFAWLIGGNLTPLIDDPLSEFFVNEGILFVSLKQLEEIGLVSFDAMGGYSVPVPQKFAVCYFDSGAMLEFPKVEYNQMDLGLVMFSRSGLELASICGAVPRPEFKRYVIENWRTAGIKVTEVPLSSVHAYNASVPQVGSLEPGTRFEMRVRQI